MNTLNRILVTLLLCAFLTSCSLFKFEGEVTAEVIESYLFIKNDTNRTIYFFACDEDDGALISINLSDHSKWPFISPGKTYRMPFSDLVWYDEGDTRAWIYWKTEKKHYGMLRATLTYD